MGDRSQPIIQKWFPIKRARRQLSAYAPSIAKTYESATGKAIMLPRQGIHARQRAIRCHRATGLLLFSQSQHAATGWRARSLRQAHRRWWHPSPVPAWQSDHPCAMPSVHSLRNELANKNSPFTEDGICAARMTRWPPCGRQRSHKVRVSSNELGQLPCLIADQFLGIHQRRYVAVVLLDHRSARAALLGDHRSWHTL